MGTVIAQSHYGYSYCPRAIMGTVIAYEPLWVQLLPMSHYGYSYCPRAIMGTAIAPQLFSNSNKSYIKKKSLFLSKSCIFN